MVLTHPLDGRPLVILDHQATFAFTVSHTTRKPRIGEVEGRNYFFVSPSTFGDLIFKETFVEQATFSENHYQLATVTPDPTTLTTTVVTITETVTVTGPVVFHKSIDIQARAVTVTPTVLPTYVFGLCTQPGIYGSACACIGISRTTTTAPTPTSVVSVTATITTTVTVPPGGCVSGSCGSYQPYQCDSASGTCMCGTIAEGETGICFTETPCDPIGCVAIWQCEDGWACIVGTCCPQPQQCFPMVPGGCEVPLPPADRMARFATAVARPLGLAE
ncbi:hypothetical protein BJX62DRAFT_241750 [Aspergillus germanicus]